MSAAFIDVFLEFLDIHIVPTACGFAECFKVDFGFLSFLFRLYGCSHWHNNRQCCFILHQHTGCFCRVDLFGKPKQVRVIANVKWYEMSAHTTRIIPNPGLSATGVFFASWPCNCPVPVYVLPQSLFSVLLFVFARYE